MKGEKFRKTYTYNHFSMFLLIVNVFCIELNFLLIGTTVPMYPKNPEQIPTNR